MNPLLSLWTSFKVISRGINKRVEKLRKRLEPSSSFHRQCDVSLLQSTVVEVEQLVSEVASTLASGARSSTWRIALDFGYKGIVQRRRAAARAPTLKPVLNVDDI